MSSPTPARGRWCILIAALLWSTSGAFTKALKEDTFFGVNEPPIQDLLLAGFLVPVQIAFYRTIFASAAFAATLQAKDIVFRKPMIGSAFCFAFMNITFVSAMALGTSANAIFLQYSAPLWVYLISTFWLGDRPDSKSTVAMWIGLAGIAIIIAGGWQGGQLDVVAIALASGLCYAGVLMFLRLLSDVSPRWITLWNHFWSAAILLPFVLPLDSPSWPQLAVIFVFGTVQMGLPYALMAYGLRSVSPQEAGTICLLEPVLNPVWAYLVSPATETPHLSTYIGGAVIVTALAWRYWPRGTRRESMESF